MYFIFHRWSLPLGFCNKDEYDSYSVFHHIRNILDVIYPPSSKVTKCFLTNYWLPSPSSHLAGSRCSWQQVWCVWHGERERGKEKRVVRAKQTDEVRERSFKKVVTYVYVSLVFIRRMTHFQLSYHTNAGKPLFPCCPFHSLEPFCSTVESARFDLKLFSFLCLHINVYVAFQHNTPVLWFNLCPF